MVERKVPAAERRGITFAGAVAKNVSAQHLFQPRTTFSLNPPPQTQSARYLTI
jgi:hypothetical protein